MWRLFCLLLTFANSLNPDQDQEFCQSWSNSKPFYAEEFFEKVKFWKKSQHMTTKAWKITKHAKSYIRKTGFEPASFIMGLIRSPWHVFFIKLLVLSADNLWKQFRPRSSRTDKPFDTLIVFQKKYFWKMSADYSKTCVKRSLSKRQKICFKINYRQMQVKSIAEFQGEHYAILWTFIKLPFVIKIFVLSIFEWLFYTGFTVHQFMDEKWYHPACKELIVRPEFFY